MPGRPADRVLQHPGNRRLWLGTDPGKVAQTGFSGLLGDRWQSFERNLDAIGAVFQKNMGFREKIVCICKKIEYNICEKV